MAFSNDNNIPRNQVGALENCHRSPVDIHGLDTTKMVRLFGTYGYLCKPEGNLRGISGVVHNFDFVCTKSTTGEKLVVQSLLHFRGDDEKFDVEILKLRLSTYDCNPDVCLLVSNSMTQQVKQMAGMYRITMIDGDSGENLYDQIEALLKLQV
jgi:hypothetical protein